ncbi:MAG TPA: cupin domain-containing protein [Segeticoccus sp.]|uniref:cupin domain-containing protein n=1 Tax=Segeticoccus sp. TaxID=2706531 RepID=UPI002D7F2299|nr:cupin domain-containing protein [Segeticoccus sp.]HET8599989.1 cupin domain-containing protein [Segeticoccus sp.]
MSDARPTVQVDDDRVRVTRWDFEPGATTGRHRHEYPYVVVPVIDGRTQITTADGETSYSELRSGESYARAAGSTHEVVNAGEAALTFVEIELKG